MLAGLRDLPKAWSWSAVCADVHPKENWYDVHAKARGLAEGPYEGREVLAREAAANYGRIRRLCAEDVGALDGRLREALGVS